MCWGWSCSSWRHVVRRSQTTVNVRNGQLVVGTLNAVNLIRHVYEHASDRELLRELYVRLGETERGGA